MHQGRNNHVGQYFKVYRRMKMKRVVTQMELKMEKK